MTFIRHLAGVILGAIGGVFGLLGTPFIITAAWCLDQEHEVYIFTDLERVRMLAAVLEERGRILGPRAHLEAEAAVFLKSLASEVEAYR